MRPGGGSLAQDEGKEILEQLGKNAQTGSSASRYKALLLEASKLQVRPKLKASRSPLAS